MKLHSVFIYEGEDEDGTTANRLRAVFQDPNDCQSSITLDVIPTSAAATAWESLEAELRLMVQQNIE